MLGARLGISYALGAPSPLRRADWSDFEPGMVYDIAAYGAWRRWTYNPNTDTSYDGGVMLVPGKFAVAGLCINPMYRVNPVFSAGAAIDAQYDEGANLSGNYVTTSSTEDPKFYRTSFTDRLSLGVSARVEFRMSLFAINIGLGRSVYAPEERICEDGITHSRLRHLLPIEYFFSQAIVCIVSTSLAI